MPPGNGLLALDALAFALASAVAFAALDLAQKWSSRYAVPTPAAFLALRLLAGAALSPLLLLLPGAFALTDFSAPTWGLLLGLTAANLLGNVLYLRSVYKADISVVGSLWPLKNLYLPFLALLLPPHERFTPLVYALVLAATVGAVGIAYNDRLRLRALTERPVWMMVLVTVPVFALSDKLLGQASLAVGARLATVLVAWGLALLGVPALLLNPATRAEVRAALTNRHGLAGAFLTGLFLVIGVACIGEAFKRAGGAVVLVNVFAMSSGLILLAANAARPGWLDTDNRRVYAVRFLGALVLIAAATALLLIPKPS